jgi:hypothetical protein
MFRANITKARLAGKFFYLQNKALANCNSPMCRVILGSDESSPAVEANVYENDNGSGGRAHCPQLFIAPYPITSLSLPLQLNDVISYEVLASGDIRVISVDRTAARSAVVSAGPSEQKAYKELISVGFEDVGRWELDPENEIKHAGDRPDYWAAIIKDFPQALYAFCVDGSPKYIGKTAATLCARFRGYRGPGDTNGPNRRCNTNIKECIAERKEVRILVLPNRLPLKWGRYSINVAAGLEDALIDELQPEWNA